MTTEFRKLLRASLMFMLLSAAGCGPVFVNPPLPMAQPDRKVMGQWLQQTDEQELRLSIYPRSPPWLQMIVSAQEPGPTGRVQVVVLDGYTAEVGENRYLCLIPRIEDTDETVNMSEVAGMYLLFRYKAGRQSLDISMLSAEYFSQLVTNGVLQGETKSTWGGPHASITSPAKDVTAALSTADPAMFEDPDETAHFRRVP